MQISLNRKKLFYSASSKVLQLLLELQFGLKEFLSLVGWCLSKVVLITECHNSHKHSQSPLTSVYQKSV